MGNSEFNPSPSWQESATSCVSGGRARHTHIHTHICMSKFLLKQYKNVNPFSFLMVENASKPLDFISASTSFSARTSSSVSCNCRSTVWVNLAAYRRSSDVNPSLLLKRLNQTCGSGSFHRCVHSWMWVLRKTWSFYHIKSEIFITFCI